MEYGGEDGVFGSTISLMRDQEAAAASDIIIEELLGEGCWIEASENNFITNQQQHQQHYMNNSNNNIMMMMGEGDHFNHHHQQTDQCSTTTTTDQDHESGGFVVGKRWWIGPRANPGPSTSVKERLVVAVCYLKDYYTNNNSSSNVLIQIWVPPPPPPLRRRSSVVHYLHHQDPNMNVDVRFFRSHEYPRHHQQQPYGSLLALPVFERGSGTCLGVLEFITNQTSLFHSYRPQLDHLSNALEAVDFRTSDEHNHNHQNMNNIPTKVFEELYEAAVKEIVEVLASVCKSHNLPLAMTWAPCIQQQEGRGKQLGCGRTAEDDQMLLMMMSCCLSTVDSACYVGDVDVLGFQEACSEYHLYNGQGTVGTAFTTTKPCFAIDITAFSKAEYPLAHHANIFGLHAAVAIPLRSLYTGSAADFVLEFFLPKDCRDPQQQKHMLNSLSLAVHQACRTLHLHLLIDDDHSQQDDDHRFAFPTIPSSDAAAAASSSTKETSSSCSWIAHMMEAQNKGKGVSVSLEYLQEPKEEFKVTTTCNWEDAEREGNSVFSEFGQVLQHDHSRASVEEAGEESGGGGRRSSSSSNGRKSGDKRRTKAEKTISLPVLRQYFAGSLKDAAKSIGVCPTTLKRICRQHGITRWPSRKIKKVGHSLKKLQLVIDSVQGAEGAIQIGSFYASFPELSTATGHSDDHHSSMHNNNNNDGGGNNNNNNCFFGDGIVTSLKSPPSACSQTHAGGGGGGITGDAAAAALMMRRSAGGEADQLLLHNNINIQDYQLLQEDQDTKQLLLHFNNTQTLLPPRPNGGSSAAALLERGAFRVKATFADEKIRFSLQAVWGLRDLQVEIARRFNLNDMNNLVLKYLDDEGEWVGLLCDTDLEECKDLHTSSHTRTIRLSLFQASPLNLPNNFSNSPTSL